MRYIFCFWVLNLMLGFCDIGGFRFSVFAVDYDDLGMLFGLLMALRFVCFDVFSLLLF